MVRAVTLHQAHDVPLVTQDRDRVDGPGLDIIRG